MPNFQDSFLSGSNIDFIEALYARFLEDPSSVDPSWRELFERQRGQGRPIYVDGANGSAGNGAAPARATLPVVAPPVRAAAPALAVALALAPSGSTDLSTKVARAV